VAETINFGLFRIKIKREDKWVTIDKTFDKIEAIDLYNSSPTPRMLTCDRGIIHKQYTNNKFLFLGK
jgi:hypothetical protein